MTLDEKIAAAKELGYRIVKHDVPREPRSAVWELMLPNQTEMRYAGIAAMAHETENEIWEHLFNHRLKNASWLKQPTT